MLTAADAANDRRHRVSLRRGTLSHSSSSRNTDAVAPELPRPCPDEHTDEAAGVSSVECGTSPSGTTRSTCADGGGGAGSDDDVLVLVLDDDECCFSVTHNARSPFRYYDGSLQNSILEPFFLLSVNTSMFCQFSWCDSHRINPLQLIILLCTIVNREISMLQHKLTTKIINRMSFYKL